MDQVNDSFRLFVAKSEQLGNVVTDLARLTERAFLAHLDIVRLAQQFKKPAQDQFAKLTSKLSQILQDVEKIKQDQKRSEFFNHIAAVAESLPAFGWIAISPAPGPFVKEMSDAAQFYTNKVLVAYKEKDKKHTEWVQSWLSFLQDLQKYIKQSHTTGLVWNPRGDELNDASSVRVTAPPPPPPGAPAPPPPPPACVLGGPKKADVDADARMALLKDLNQGTDITKNLRKINLDSSSAAGAGRGASRSKTPEPRFGAASPAGIPKFEFEGRKWMVEFQDGSKQGNRDNFTIEADQMNQVVNVYKCSNITISVKGKINSITVDSSKNVRLAFEDIVSFVEFINCQKIQAYPVGKVATITVDKTDSIQLFLREKSLDVDIITAKSSEINCCIVNEATGDYKEYALPEQLKTVWSGGQFKTVAMPKA